TRKAALLKWTSNLANQESFEVKLSDIFRRMPTFSDKESRLGGRCRVQESGRSGGKWTGGVAVDRGSA
ncbi:MAG: hypothetical protein ACYC61_21330, partial [Isosphaeraceae bacterium]